jgi:hypothetical protein
MAQYYYSHSFQSEGNKMTVFSKQNYEDQDEGRIMKAARKQQYIMFPAPIAFLIDELKQNLECCQRNRKKKMMQIFYH